MKTGNIFLIVILCTGATASAQLKYSRIKLKIPAQGLAWLQSQGVQFDHGEIKQADHTFITTLSNTDLTNLRKTGTPYTVLIDDEAKDFVENGQRGNFYEYQNALMVDGKLHFENSCGSAITTVPVPGSFIEGSYGGYYKLADQENRITHFLTNYPGLIDTIHLPIKSIEGRPLIVIKISDNATSDENEPEALYTGMHHPREGMSMMNLYFFIGHLLENYQSDHRIKALVDSRELFFLPCVNPDGLYYNENVPVSQGRGMWRKNRRNNGSNYSRGVDINRNYGVDWGQSAPNASFSTIPGDDTYIGTAPFSEPETQAIKAFSETRHFTIAIDHHAYGNYYVTPYSYQAGHSFTPEDTHFYTYAPALMAKYNGYHAGNGMATVGYWAMGGSRDWHIAGDIGTGTKQKTYGFTVEIGSSSTGFWPSKTLIVPLAQGMVFANLQMAYMAGSYFELQDLDKMSVTGDGQFNFSLRRIGLTNAPVTVRIIPVENIQTVGPDITINSMPQYFNVQQAAITYTLPNLLAPESRIRFIYEVSSGGITLRDTITKYYMPVSLLDDDLEAIGNWERSSGSLWNLSTSNPFQGSRSLTESPSGNYRANENSSIQYRHAIDLSNATSAFLSFWVRHRAENSYDKMEVQLSTDAGNNWTPVCGNGTVKESVNSIGNRPSLTGMREVWRKETVDLRNYLNQADVRLQFAFTANDENQYDGFYIDNVEIVKSSSLALPVRFTNIEVKRLVKGGALLTWEAFTDAQFDYFEVQRSDDGIHFNPIGTVRGFPPYRFTDPAPATVSYYRVRAIDKQNHSWFSKTVTLTGTLKNNITVTPNPVSSTLYVSYVMEQPASFRLSVTDVMGKTVFLQELTLGKGTGYRSIPAGTWPQQMYFVKLKNLKTGQQSVHKIVKK